MDKKHILPLAFIGFGVVVQTTSMAASDSLQPILDRLDSIEKRLDDLENKAQSVVQDQTEPSTNAAATTNAQDAVAMPLTPQKSELVSGIIVKIKRADAKTRSWFTEGVSAEHFAGYVATSAEITTPDIYEKTLGYTGAYALTIEGYFNATEKGLYSFGVLHQKMKKTFENTHCSASLSLDGISLAELEEEIQYTKSDGEVNMLVNGSATLEAGIYEYSVFSACQDYMKSNYIKRSLLVKTPNDLSMRAITDKDILHKK